MKYPNDRYPTREEKYEASIAEKTQLANQYRDSARKIIGNDPTSVRNRQSYLDSERSLRAAIRHDQNALDVLRGKPVDIVLVADGIGQLTFGDVA